MERGWVEDQPQQYKYSKPFEISPPLDAANGKPDGILQ